MNIASRNCCKVMQTYLFLSIITTITAVTNVTVVWMSHFLSNCSKKNPAYMRQRISQPMRIVAPILFTCKNLSLRLFMEMVKHENLDTQTTVPGHFITSESVLNTWGKEKN